MFKNWRFWLGAAISAFFIVIALRGLDLIQVWHDVQSANYWWIIPGVVAYFMGVWIRTWRWHYLLRPIKPISLNVLWPIVVIGYMGNNIYPFRAGEVMRAFLLKKKEAVSFSASIATILVERIFDGLVMLLFVFVALPFVPWLPAWLRQMVVMASLAFFGALALFLIMAALPQSSQKIYRWVITKFLPTKWQAVILTLADRFMDGLGSLRSFRNVFMIFFTSVIVWLLETVKYWFVMHAFRFSVTFFALMLMNGVVNLATTIPSAPGYIGTFDTPGIEVLKVFGVDPVVATAYTFVLHAALWLPITLLGIWEMVRQSLSWQDFSKAAAEVQLGSEEDKTAPQSIQIPLSPPSSEKESL